MLVALGVPPLSIASQLYQPARPAPICAIHGHTRSGGASIVIACVEAKIGSGTSASTGSGRRFSRAVAMQVAATITLEGAFAVPDQWPVRSRKWEGGVGN